MAKYRAIQTAFWSDPWILGLTQELKFFYIYLFTNPKSSQCGIYEISIVQMQHETGFEKDKIVDFIQFLEHKKKIKYNAETAEICVINFSKYNYSSSPSIKKCIKKEFAKVKDLDLIKCIYGIDTLFTEYIKGVHDISTDHDEKEKEEKKEAKQEKQNSKNCDVDLVKDILSFFGFNMEKDEGKKQEVNDFLTKLIDLDRIQEFKEQFNSYKEYKDKSGEKVHGFSRFLGTPDNDFRDGGWNSENWEFKLTNVKKTVKTKESSNNRYQAGEKDHGNTTL